MKNADTAVAKVAKSHPHAHPDDIVKGVCENGREKKRGK